MKVEPSILDGPKVCTDCEGWCDHPKTMQYIGIYWQTDDGEEWGQSGLIALRDGKISDSMRDTIERALWERYDEWLALQLT